jgi:glycerol-3-phosphate dehydrogenase (NAD(P)+)
MSNSALKIGILGAGKFGTALASIIARKHDVLMFTRQEENILSINRDHQHSYLGYVLSDRVVATNDIEKLCDQCQLIFPVIPSEIFREVMKQFNPYLRPDHFLIHGTKGLYVEPTFFENKQGTLRRNEVLTMSEIIEQETSVLRIGCISGPNLSEEIMEGQPTATVVSSKFREVILAGKNALNTKVFRVFESTEIKGAELAGTLKNIIAIGSGILAGKGLGKNMQAMLITKGLSEIVHLGKSLDISPSIFLGTAGLGDVIATATSVKSRNFRFGKAIGAGRSVQEIMVSSDELVEGYRTLKIAHGLIKHYKLRLPITTLLYRMVYEAYDLQLAIEYLMQFPYDKDVGFL